MSYDPPQHRALLDAICLPDEDREIVRRPWSVVFDGRPYVAATDGARILCLEGVNDSPPPPIAKFIAHIEDAPRPTHQVDQSSLVSVVGIGPAVCPICGGSDFPPCGRCGGEGEIECNLGHFHDCPDCEESDCPGPGPHFGRAEFHPVAFAGLPAIIDARRLRGIVTALPWPMTVGASGEIIALRGPGWLLVVMGLRHDALKPINHIATKPITQGEDE